MIMNSKTPKVSKKTDIPEIDKELALLNMDLLKAIKNFQSGSFETDNYEKIFYQLLETVVRLTNSEYGFIGEVVESKNKEFCLKPCVTASKERVQSTASLQKICHFNEVESYPFQALLRRVVETKEITIVEKSELQQFNWKVFAGIPICADNRLIAVLCLANRPQGYNKELFERLQPLMLTVANLIQVRHHEDSRIESKELLKLFIKHNPAAVAMFDQDLKYLLASDAWSKNYNLKWAEIEGKNLSETFSDVPQRWKNFQETCLCGKVEVSEEEELVLPNGKKGWIKWEAHPWYKSDKEVGGIILFTETITERKKTQLKMQKVIDDLKRSNQELERFAYICSHDLKEPLRTIASFAHLIYKNNFGTFDQETQQYFDFVQKGIQRMKSLIEDILVYSKVGSKNTHYSVVSVGNIISEIKEILSFQLKESKTKIEIGYLPDIYGDNTQLMQLFRNLIENSIKFHSSVDPIIKIEAVGRSDGYWQFIVRDNGIGIEEEYRDKVFLMFERLHSKERYEGSGIGLSVCKKIVEHHGGKIWVTSNVFGGCDFCFTLPSWLIEHKFTA